jgi:hypothetical protein
MNSLNRVRLAGRGGGTINPSRLAKGSFHQPMLLACRNARKLFRSPQTNTNLLPQTTSLTG